MRMPVAVAACAGALVALTALASPASAACATGDLTCQDVSFTLDAGTISLITTGTATGATTTLSGGTAQVEVTLGATVVNETRLDSPGWAVSATASSFATTGGTIDKSAAAFSVPVAPTAPTGVVGVPLCPTAKTVVKTTPTAVNATTGTTSEIIKCTQTGVSGATFVPVLTISVPAGSPSGTYTGTVTQSVS